MNSDTVVPSKFLYLLKETELQGIFPDWPEFMNLAVWVDVNADFAVTVYRMEELDQVISRVAQEADMEEREICVIPEEDGYPTVNLLFSHEQAIMKMIEERKTLVEMAADYSVNYQFCLDEGIDPKKALEPASPPRNRMDDDQGTTDMSKETSGDPQKTTLETTFLSPKDLKPIHIFEKRFYVGIDGAVRMESLTDQSYVAAKELAVSGDFSTLRFSIPQEISVADHYVVFGDDELPKDILDMFCGDVRLIVHGSDVIVERPRQRPVKEDTDDNPVSNPERKSGRLSRLVVNAVFGCVVVITAAIVSNVVTNDIVDHRLSSIDETLSVEPGELNFQELRDRILKAKPFNSEDE